MENHTDELEPEPLQHVVHGCCNGADLVFAQAQRVEVIDDGRDKAGVQAKPCADTRAEAFACPGASEDWVIGARILSRAGTAVENTVRGLRFLQA